MTFRVFVKNKFISYTLGDQTQEKILIMYPYNESWVSSVQK